MESADWLAEITHRSLAGVLGPGARVLEVGCGRGHLSRRLGADGFTVTALDLEIAREDQRPVPGVRYLERDFLEHEGEPQDAVLFTASLHHIHELDGAMERARELLRPGGLLIADDFDLAASNEATCRWNYNLEARCGLPSKSEGAPLERWRIEHEHEHHHPLHTGAEMVEAIDRRFELQEVTRGAYLYRSFVARLGDAAAGNAAALRRQELRAIGTGEIAAVGLRIVAQRADAPR